MSGPNWSPEPWVHDDGSVYGVDGAWVFDWEAMANLADRDRVVACVNFLAGIPTDALTAPDHSDARALALAVLRGDELAAHGLADELLERRRQPEGFVSRAELVEALATYHAFGGDLSGGGVCRACGGLCPDQHVASCITLRAAALLRRLGLYDIEPGVTPAEVTIGRWLDLGTEAPPP